MEEQSQGRKQQLTGFMLEAQGPDALFAIFSEDQGAGYFFVYEPKMKVVHAQIRVYVSTPNLSVKERDVQLLWSSDWGKCGVAIWGRMRGVIDIATRRELCIPLKTRHSEAITDPEWLNGFEDYLDWHEFLQARGKYWREMVQRYQPGIQPSGDTPLETSFIVYMKGPAARFAVFEDEGATGYLYLYNSEQQKVAQHLHLYDRSEKLNVSPEDVVVLWSKDGKKCGVVIWEKMRGIIDITKDRPGRVWLESRETPGIDDPEWLRGF